MRKVLFSFVFFLSMSVSLPAQAMVTSDILNIAHLTQLINQVYSSYDNVMATIEQVQNTYEQLKRQAEMVMTIPEKFEKFKENIGDVDLTTMEGFLKFRSQYADTISYINYNMNLLNNIYDTFTKKKISFGGRSYTFGGLIGFAGADRGTNLFNLPMNIAEYMTEQAKEGMAGYANKLTREQKAAIMAKYGLSPENYYKLRLVEHTVALPFDELLAEGSKEASELRDRARQEKAQYIQELKELAGDSMVSQVEVSIEAQLMLNDDINEMVKSVKKLISVMAHEQFRIETNNEIYSQQLLKRIKNSVAEEEFKRISPAFNGF